MEVSTIHSDCPACPVFFKWPTALITNLGASILVRDQFCDKKEITSWSSILKAPPFSQGGGSESGVSADLNAGLSLAPNTPSASELSGDACYLKQTALQASHDHVYLGHMGTAVRRCQAKPRI